MDIISIDMLSPGSDQILKLAKLYKKNKKEKTSFCVDSINYNLGLSMAIHPTLNAANIKVSLHTLQSHLKESSRSMYKISDLKDDMDNVLSLLKQLGVKESNIIMNFDEKDFKTKDGVRYLRNEYTLGELSLTEQRLKRDWNAKVYYSEHFHYLPELFNHWNDFDDFNSDMKKLSDEGVLWTLPQLRKANFCVEEVANIIKENNLSPMEAISYIDRFISKNLSYDHEIFEKENLNDDVRYELTNSIVAAINRKKITCVGYSSFIQAVADRLDEFNNGDYLDVSMLSVYNKNGCHSICSANIKDKKYDSINRKVLLDGTCALMDHVLKSFEKNLPTYFTVKNGIYTFKTPEHPIDSLKLKNTLGYKELSPNDYFDKLLDLGGRIFIQKSPEWFGDPGNGYDQIFPINRSYCDEYRVNITDSNKIEGSREEYLEKPFNFEALDESTIKKSYKAILNIPVPTIDELVERFEKKYPWMTEKEN